MIKNIYDESGKHFIREVDAEPVCGKDFCDACGDCLSCYDGDSCFEGKGDHFWVQYGEDPPHVHEWNPDYCIGCGILKSEAENPFGVVG